MRLATKRCSFDLIDRPFDESLPSIRKLSEILGGLKRSEHASVRLDLGGGWGVVARLPLLSPHASRRPPGLLIVGEYGSATGPRKPLLAQAFDEQPVAGVATIGGSLHANRAGKELFAADQLLGLSTLLGGADRVERLVKNITTSGVARELLKLQTAFGEREIKVTGRRASKGDRQESLVFLFEDVSERRALERELSGRAPIAAPSSQGREKSAVSRLSRADETAFNALGQALKSAGETPPVKPQPKLAPIELPQAVVRGSTHFPTPPLSLKGGAFTTSTPARSRCLAAKRPMKS